MPEVIVLNGAPCVGKTSVLAELSALHRGTVAISGEALRAFAPPDARAHLGGGATFKVAGALAAAYLQLGAVRVVFEYVFLRAAHFRYFGEALPAHVTVQIFTLWAPLELLLERDYRRPESQRAGVGIADNCREMQQNLASMGRIVDVEASAPARLAARIHELARQATAASLSG